MIGVMIVLAYMCPLSMYIYRIVGEKESKIKEGMKIMGLGEAEYFLSYFIQFVVINFFVSLVNAWLFKSFMNYIPYYHIFFMMFLWSLNVFSLIYFFQSFIDKTKIALVLSLVIYFMMYCTSLACMFEGGSQTIKILLSLFPQVCLNNGVLLLSKFQCHFRYFRNRDFFVNYTNFSLGLMYLMFVVDFLLFLFLGFYLHNVLPHDFGIRKPLYFLCTSDFWCSGKNKRKEKLEIEKKLEVNYNNEEYKIYKTKDYNSNESDNVSEKLYGNSPNFESEEIYKDKTKKDDVLKIRNIVKIFWRWKKSGRWCKFKFL
jgi:ATP-binding cassette subfamily A (ABC1) protein 3